MSKPQPRAKGTTTTTFAPGGDAKLIKRIVKDHFGDSYQKMFEYHDWPERGEKMIQKVQSRVVERYGSVVSFGKDFDEQRVSNELLLENLKAIQGKLSIIASDIVDLKADMLTVKGHMAAFMQAEIRQDSAAASLTVRVERIERRRELRD